MGPKPTPTPACRQEKEGLSQEGIGAQAHYTPGPRDLLWEHEPTLPWVLVISRPGHQGQVEPSGRLSLQLLMEDWHAPPELRPKAEVAV